MKVELFSQFVVAVSDHGVWNAVLGCSCGKCGGQESKIESEESESGAESEEG